MIEKKIKSLEEIVEIVNNAKNKGKKIVHCHGCFDYAHYGHSLHFKEAKNQGDILIVTVTPDEFIKKGEGRPYFNQEIRVNQLSCLEFVDYVSLNRWESAIETIKLIKPDVYVKGKEVLENDNVDQIQSNQKISSNLSLEIEALNIVGGRLYLTEALTLSSSRLINQITSAIPEESKEYLKEIRNNFGSERILKELDRLKNIRPLIIGDSILDEYIYCQSMERSGKEPLISYKHLRSEIHLGGIFAVSNHLSNFIDEISMLTIVGENHNEIIDNSINKNIKKIIIPQKDSNTLVKTRYLEDYTGRKIFQVYNNDELKIDKTNEEKVIQLLKKELKDYDLIITSDFGHGMISDSIKDYIANCGKYLAVNCQLNAGNLGYNFITKYPRADFISLNDRELRLPLQEKNSDIKVPITKLSKIFVDSKINVTLGKYGSIYYHNNEFYYAPSFTKEPKDTVGSGDAVFALTSLLSYNNCEPNIVPFLGNSIGALATKIVGNQRAINNIELRKFISYILK